MNTSVDERRTGAAGGPAATRALVLHPVLRHSRPAGASERSPEACLEEAVGLAQAIDIEVVDARLVPVATRRPATLLGKGKLAELGEVLAAGDIGVVILDTDLTPVQQRNLERAWKTKVLDRTGLILEIFGARARTREGELQVELAHLVWQRSRLVRSWTHLERQRGGFGFLGGPGETQIEADRRVIGARIAQIREQLAGVIRTRDLHRRERAKTPFPLVALVGYTNAGKSTLFNRLTNSAVMAEDMLFATLDPTMRAITLGGGSGRKVILSDTVGFISDLPTHLVAAFRATLEEVRAADLIVHVRDAAHADSEAQRRDVLAVLDELGVGETADGPPILEALNKVDLLDADARAALLGRTSGEDTPVPISALDGSGLDALAARIDSMLARHDLVEDIVLAPGEGAALAWLYRNARIVAKSSGPQGDIHVTVRISPVAWQKFCQRTGRGAAPGVVAT